MTRFFIAGVLALTACSPAFAQDMPLSQILIDGEGWKKVEKPAAKLELIDPTTRSRDLALANAVTYSPDGGTLFASMPKSPFLWAAQARANGETASAVVPYAFLPTRRGEPEINATSLATDRDGRIYAATDIGVQVFDPTGRLCGVLTPAAPGKPEAMAFEGDKLTLWIGETKYARKLNTQGVK